MRRKLLNLATGLCLLLLAGVVAAWGWSYRRSDRLTWRWVENGPARAGWGDVHLSSAAGGMGMSFRRSRSEGAGVTPVVRREPLGLTWTTHRPPTYPRRVDGPGFDWERWGFAWDWRRERGTSDPGEPARTEAYVKALAIVPHAALAPVVGALPLGRGAAVVWRRVRRARRSAAGRCGGCGYDLRGGSADGRCPECGEGGGR